MRCQQRSHARRKQLSNDHGELMDKKILLAFALGLLTRVSISLATATDSSFIHKANVAQVPAYINVIGGDNFSASAGEHIVCTRNDGSDVAQETLVSYLVPNGKSFDGNLALSGKEN